MSSEQQQQSDTAALSQREFRTCLYDQLRQSGIAGQLKSQLRQRLVRELRGASNESSGLSPSSTQSKQNTMPVVDALVGQHLRARGYEFTLSVFVPEAQLSMANEEDTKPNLMAVDSLLRRALNLPVGDSAASSLIGRRHRARARLMSALLSPPTANANDASALDRLLVGVRRALSTQNTSTDGTEMEDDSTEDQWTQTTDHDLQPDGPTSVMDKLRMVDQQYAVQSETDRLAGQAVLEERMLQYQQECDRRVEELVKTRVGQWRDKEAEQIRVEERARYERELDAVKESFAAEEEQRRKALKQLEDAVQEKLARREKEQQQEIYAERQRLLKEFDQLKQQEENVRREQELNQRAALMEEEKARRMQHEASAQLLEAQNLKHDLQRKLKDEVQKYQLQYDREHAHVLVELRTEKAQLETERKLLGERSRQFEVLTSQLAQMQQELASAREAGHQHAADVQVLRKETELLRHANAQLKTTNDTLQGQAKTMHASLEMEIFSMKKQLLDHEKQAQQLQQSREVALAKVEETARDVHKYKKVALKYQREVQQLLLKLEAVSNSNEEATRRLDDETIRNKELQREVADLRLLLHHTQTAYATEVGVREDYVHADRDYLDRKSRAIYGQSPVHNRAGMSKSMMAARGGGGGGLPPAPPVHVHQVTMARSLNLSEKELMAVGGTGSPLARSLRKQTPQPLRESQRSNISDDEQLVQARIEQVLRSTQHAASRASSSLDNSPLVSQRASLNRTISPLSQHGRRAPSAAVTDENRPQHQLPLDISELEVQSQTSAKPAGDRYDDLLADAPAPVAVRETVIDIPPTPKLLSMNNLAVNLPSVHEAIAVPKSAAITSESYGEELNRVYPAAATPSEEAVESAENMSSPLSEPVSDIESEPASTAKPAAQQQQQQQLAPEDLALRQLESDPDMQRYLDMATARRQSAQLEQSEPAAAAASSTSSPVEYERETASEISAADDKPPSRPDSNDGW